jgi:hypothetical protein
MFNLNTNVRSKQGKFKYFYSILTILLIIVSASCSQILQTDNLGEVNASISSDNSSLSSVSDKISIIGVELERMPNKITFTPVDQINTTGGQLRVIYSNYTSKIVSINESMIDLARLSTSITGKTNVTLKYQENSESFFISYPITIVEYKIEVEDVKIDFTDVEMIQGQKVNFNYLVSPSNATIENVEWISSNPKIAAIDDKGNVSAINPGETTITVRLNGQESFDTKLKVKSAPIEITEAGASSNQQGGQGGQNIQTFNIDNDNFIITIPSGPMTVSNLNSLIGGDITNYTINEYNFSNGEIGNIVTDTSRQVFPDLNILVTTNGVYVLKISNQTVRTNTFPDKLYEPLNDGVLKTPGFSFQGNNKILIRITNDRLKFSIADATDITSSVTANNIPNGITYTATKVSPSYILITIGGDAENHTTAQNVNNFNFTISNSILSLSSNSLVTSSIPIDFSSESTFIPFRNLFESFSNDGTIQFGRVDVLLLSARIKNTVVDGTIEVDVKTYITANNLPSGLNFTAVSRYADFIEILITGAASNHASANTVTNITFTISGNNFLEKIDGTPFAGGFTLVTDQVTINFRD